MTLLWTWEASARGRAAAGVSDDMVRAQRAAARWMRDHDADAGLLEEVLLVLGGGSLLTRHERTGVALRARRYQDGSVRWRPASAPGEA